MSARLHTYLSDTHNRGKVMAILQFLPMTLEASVRSAGCDALATSLANLSKMADTYRAVTRLGLIVNAFAPETLKAQAKPKEDVFLWRLDQIIHGFHMAFCVNECTAVLAGRGVFRIELMRIGRIAVLCWLYTLVLGIVRQSYLLVKHCSCTKDATVQPYTQAERKRAYVHIIKLSSYVVFALTCLPVGKPQLLLNVSGPFVPLHKLIQFMAPNPLHLSHTMRGLMGLIASACEFY